MAKKRSGACGISVKQKIKTIEDNLIRDLDYQAALYLYGFEKKFDALFEVIKKIVQRERDRTILKIIKDKKNQTVGKEIA